MSQQRVLSGFFAATAVVLSLLLTPTGTAGESDPMPKPAGPGYSFNVVNDSGNPARWNPCGVHTWSSRELTPLDRRLTRGAFRQIAKATRWKFSEVRRGQADVVISANYAKGYGSSFSGLGGPWHITPPSRPVSIIDATVTLNLHRRGPVAPRRFLILHELGHAMNLHHVKSRNQVMYGGNNNARLHAKYQPGDLRGLRSLGSDRTCMNPPLPVENARGSWVEDLNAGNWVLELEWDQPFESRAYFAEHEATLRYENGVDTTTEFLAPSDTTARIWVRSGLCRPNLPIKIEVNNYYGITRTSVTGPECPADAPGETP